MSPCWLNMPCKAYWLSMLCITVLQPAAALKSKRVQCMDEMDLWGSSTNQAAPAMNQAAQLWMGGATGGQAQPKIQPGSSASNSASQRSPFAHLIINTRTRAASLCTHTYTAASCLRSAQTPEASCQTQARPPLNSAAMPRSKYTIVVDNISGNTRSSDLE